MKNNLVSIVVPLYNYACYISDLIESVMQQSYKEWELIIIDDDSTDEPLSVIKPWFKDCKILYHKLDNNGGYARAKNEGIIRSRGEYIVVLDADDMLTERSLEYRVNFLNKNEFKWVHAKAYEFSGRKPYNFKFKRRKFIKYFEKIKRTGDYSKVWMAIHAQTVMVRRIVYERVGLYEETMRSMSDKEMWARINNVIGRPGYIDRFVSCYRMHNRQMHKSKDKIRNLSRLKKRLKRFISKRKRGNMEDIRCF